MKEIKETITFRDTNQAKMILGAGDENLKVLEHKLPISIVARDAQLHLKGTPEQVGHALDVVRYLIALSETREVGTGDVHYALSLDKGERVADKAGLFSEILLITARGKQIRAKTLGQKQYIDQIKAKTICFGIGPAGTGKTYLAVIMAVAALKKKQVERIVLTRPAVEAGEKLGFLPGDLQDKVDPYLRPLYDGLYDALGMDVAQRYMEKGIIEIAPLAYMRGRTLDDAFIILDEAQNTTPEQMKMFLTRIGFGSKAVVTGDITQIDLPRASQSGLVKANKILTGIEEIGFSYLQAEDVVRHPVVAQIIRAYERYAEEGKE